MKRIFILGGGFGGLYTALELADKEWPDPPEIVVVDRDRQFLFTPLLYELVTGEMEAWEIAPSFDSLLSSTSVQFRQGEVEQIEISTRRVTLQDGSHLNYDYLVLALGGDTLFAGVPGAREYALPFRELADAEALKADLEKWQRRTDRFAVAIAGAGASGVELACKLVDCLGDRVEVRLIDRSDDILKGFQPDSRQAARKALQQRGVVVQLDTSVLQVGEDFILTQTGDAIETLPVARVLWTAGVTVNPAVEKLSLAKSDRDRVSISPTLQTLEHPEIFALGDLAEGRDAVGQTIPATAQSAFQQASYCAWNLWALATAGEGKAARPLLPFRYLPLGEMLSLGTDSASLSGLGLAFDGPLAYLARRTIYLMRLPTLNHQLEVGWNWVTKPLFAEVQRWMQGDRP
ncbi:NAD(P)/FAD-dependent oxidoreductase [Synechococcus sp. PCC 7336]|uniref:NAD(P)/FAD-dependent oxidoreductase n=1 Tax=Synechococcus sp. PCC 7336 TaxID=195250 RepID=UPI0003666692|nr:NAD(P)/FAD-dependent oxidoreductase [Synechococcus sp. PCC 7336]